MVFVLMGFASRMDLRGVTSFVSALGLAPCAYRRLLHVFHSSAIRLDKLTECWLRLCRLTVINGDVEQVAHQESCRAISQIE